MFSYQGKFSASYLPLRVRETLSGMNVHLEKLLVRTYSNQKGCVVWITGLSGSGLMLSLSFNDS